MAGNRESRTTRLPPEHIADLWLVELDESAAESLVDARVQLDPDETIRARQFASHADRRLYVAAHSLLRSALGACLGVAPMEVPLPRPPVHGEPLRVAPCAGREGPFYSLSHTRGAVMIGVALSGVGVDVERVVDSDTLSDVVPLLHPREQVEIRDSGGESCGLFTQLWTRKEAYRKALGQGLTASLDADDVGHELEEPRLVGSRWVWDVPAGEHLAAAAATSVRVVEQRIRHLKPSASECRALMSEPARMHHVRFHTARASL